MSSIGTHSKDAPGPQGGHQSDFVPYGSPMEWHAWRVVSQPFPSPVNVFCSLFSKSVESTPCQSSTRFNRFWSDAFSVHGIQFFNAASAARRFVSPPSSLVVGTEPRWLLLRFLLDPPAFASPRAMCQHAWHLFFDLTRGPRP